MLQTGPQRGTWQAGTWQTRMWHGRRMWVTGCTRLKVAASCRCCCCQLPLARQACRMVYPITMPIDKMLTGVPERATPIPIPILLPFPASGREDFCNSLPNLLLRCTYNGNCAETASHTHTLDRQDTVEYGRWCVFLASLANFHASQFFEARLASLAS